MKKVGIGIDKWKLEIFSRHLEEAGYSFACHEFTRDTYFLQVQTESISALAKVIGAADKECKDDSRSPR